eukprot:scaffold15633_cov60-Phaeocystis_antarctica.AAC.13
MSSTLFSANWTPCSAQSIVVAFPVDLPSSSIIQSSSSSITLVGSLAHMLPSCLTSFRWSSGFMNLSILATLSVCGAARGASKGSTGVALKSSEPKIACT